MKSFFTLLLLIPVMTFSQSHRMSSGEKNLMPDYLRTVQGYSFDNITTPPVSAVRAPAEWEEIDYLMVAWTSFTSIIREIVRAAQSETQVIILCTDSNAVKTSLTSASIPLTNVHYLEVPFNTIWSRDYGQWNIYTNDVDSLALIDWIYNRPRPSDDTVPRSIERFTGLPMYSMTAAPYDLTHTGGNYMVDGFGTAFSSKLVLDENPTKTEADIDTIMRRFMGINRYIKMETLPYDDIHHIDMHIKLLDEETLLVGEYPQGVADGPQIEANLQYVLSNFNSVFGTPYKVIRIPMPPDASNSYPNVGGDYRTYTNSVFVNNTIILPTYSQQYDTTAIRIYHEALPGYTITGINCNSIIPSLGAIHCITKEVASNDPLLISHQALHDTYQTTGTYPVTALIKHRSGIQSATLYYRTDTTLAYQAIAMNSLSSQIDHWGAVIPAQPAGTTVYYYIEATSVSGKTKTRPMPAPAGYWKFNVLLNTGIAAQEISEPAISNLYPNPSHGITCIETNFPVNTSAKVTVTNIFGQEIETLFSGIISGEKNFFVETSNYAAGVYFIDIQSSKGRTVKQFIIN